MGRIRPSNVPFKGLLLYGDGKDWTPLSEATRAELLAQDDRLRKRGDIVEAVAPAICVRAWEGTPVIEGGPFARSDLPMVGFGLIEARDRDEAIALVARTPCAVAKGVIEVWPVRKLE